MTKTIGILQTGEGAAELHASHGNYGKIWQDWLTQYASCARARCYDVRRGILPKSPHECDGWIVTGSDDHVYDRLAWMPAAEEFLRQIFAAKVPLIGICYGHQMLAHTLGGTVERAKTGLEIGLKRYKWAGHAEQVVLPAYHFDQVTHMPDGARLLASNATCPHAALAYDDHAITVQGHPEFTADYLRALISLDLDDPITGPTLRDGLKSLETLTSSAASISRTLGHFLCQRSF